MKMNYGFGEDQVTKTSTPFPVGACIDNVEITDCKYISGTSAAGKEWEAIDFSYTRGGATINDRIFAINPENVFVRSFIPDDTHEAAVEDKIKVFNTQLKHIATKLNITDEQLKVCNMSSFKTMAEDYCKLILSKCKGSKLYMKTTLNGGFTKVCRNPNATTPFLQRMDSEGGVCTLEYTPRELTNLAAEQAPKNGVSGSTTTTEWLASDSHSV